MEARSEIRFPMFRAVHPGEVIAEELKERGLKQRDFARAVGMRVSDLGNLLRGKRALVEDEAVRIAAELGLKSAELMGLQMQYDSDRAQLAVSAGNEIMLLSRSFPQLNIVQMAQSIGINQTLLMSFVYGKESPNEEQVAAVRRGLHELGQALISV